MPYKPKRPCRWPGCSELSDGPYCPEHQKQMDAHYNRYQRDPESRHRYGRAWRQIRDRHLKQHPLCEMCLKAGRYTTAQEVHHIVPLSRGGTHDSSNLMSLCKPCHSRITVEDGDRWPKKE